MSEYTLNKVDALNIDAFIKANPKIKDLFLIDGIEDSDNISLLNARCKFLYYKILELESRLKAIERRPA
jgi:hypothetical protein